MVRTGGIKWTVILNLGVAISAILIFSATVFDEPTIKQFLYQFWGIHFLKPELPLRFILVVIVLAFFSVLYGEKAASVDLSLAMLGSVLLSLFVIMRLIYVLELGFKVLLPTEFLLPRPPLVVTGIVNSLLAASLITAKGFLMGSLVCRQRNAGLMEKMCLIAGFGFGVTSLQVTVLALIKMVHQGTLVMLDLAVLGSLVACNIYLSKRLPTFVHKRQKWRLPVYSTSEKLTLLVISVIMAIAVYYSSAAIIEWDSLAYIAHYAKVIFLNHGVLDGYGPSIGLEMSASYPIGFQSLGVYFYNYIGGIEDFYFRILPPAFFAFSLVASYLFFNEIISRRVQRLQCVLLVTATPVYLQYALQSSHYMPYLVFLSTMALFYSMKYSRSRDEIHICVAFLFAGLSSIVSYVGLLIFSFPLIAILLSRSRPRQLRRAFLALLTGGLMPTAYLVRNLIVTGDPVFPILTRKEGLLWKSNEAHFKLISTQTGLNLSSPFSMVDFLYMRSIGLRPWVIFIVFCGSLLVLFLYKKKGLRTISLQEKLLLTYFGFSTVAFIGFSTFERYALPMIAVYASFFGWIVDKLKELRLNRLLNLSKLVVAYSVLALVLSAQYQFVARQVAFGYNEADFKSEAKDQLDFLTFFYPGDAKAWRWLNDNTDKNDKIATFDIRYYHINREVFPLDSRDAEGLYGVRVEEAIETLQQLGVKYIFSTSWVSPMSPITPPAYYQNPLTKNLGDPRLLPVVYSRYSSAIYHVGPLENTNLPERMIDKGEISPQLDTKTAFSLASCNFSDNVYALSIHIPADYHERAVLSIRVKADQPVLIEIWRGLVQGDISSHKKGNFPIARSERSASSLVWVVRGGAYTLTFTAPDLTKTSVILVESELHRI